MKKVLKGAYPIRCLNCGYKGESKRFIRGSIYPEIFLWIIFLPAGIHYSIWRLNSRYIGCPKCKNESVVKL